MDTDCGDRCCKLSAILRKERLQAVMERLHEEGVEGVSIHDVKGFGEYGDFYRHDWLVTHSKLEIFCHEDEAERLCRVIHDAAVTGVPGDGIIAILPVTSLRHIRGNGPGA